MPGTTRVFRTIGILILVSGSVVRAQAPQGTPDVPTMVGVQDLAWSADGGTLFFSAMRVKRDYSDYTPDKWAVYRYDLRAALTSMFSATSFSVCPSSVDARVVVGRLVGGNRDLYVLDGDGRVLTQLTTDPAEDFGCSWSPDGRQIAFTSKRDGHAEVYVAKADGSEPKRLTRHASDRSLSPSWSPDGRSLAYYLEKGDGQDQVHVMNPDGLAGTNVTNDAFNNVFPGWTADGRVIYGQGVKGKPTTRVFTVDRDGTNKRPLLNLESFYARYSPNGGQIAYIANAGAGGAGIVIADRAGTALTTIPLDAVGRGASLASPTAMMNHFPVWSPLNSQILFDSDRDGDSEIYTIDADSGVVRKLTDNTELDANARWTSDGGRVIFRSVRAGKEQWLQMDPDGRHQQAIDEPPDGDEVISRDGHIRIVLDVHDGNSVLVALRADGVRQPLTRGSWASQPAFSHDGSQIVYEDRIGEDLDRSRIVVMNRDGSGKRELAVGTDPSWSPDGREILFKTPSTKRGGFGWEIAVVSANGGALERLAPGVLPSRSFDGRRIAFMVETHAVGSDIWVMNRDGSGRRCLTCAH